MKTLLAGMAIVLASMGGLTATAGAAEIPPTPECSKLGKKLIRGELFVNSDWLSEAGSKKAERKLTRDLAKADCISDAEPLLKEMKAKPRSKQCVAATKSAGKLWAPTTRRVNRLISLTGKRLKPLRKRSQQLTKKIKRFKSKGASKKRIQRLKRTRQKVNNKVDRIDSASFRKTVKIVHPISDDVMLVLMELGSLRCYDEELATIFLGNGRNDPFSQLFQKHLMTITYAFLDVTGMLEMMEAILVDPKGNVASVSQKVTQVVR